MSNRLYQGILHQMKDSLESIVGVLDNSGTVIASNDPALIGQMRQGIREELSYAADTLVVDGFTYRFAGSGTRNDIVVFVEGEDRAATHIAGLLAVSFSNIRNLHEEKYDKASFIKNIILDNVLPSDIYIKSKELHFEGDERRVIYLVRFAGRPDLLPCEILQGMFPDREHCFVLNISDTEAVLVKTVEEKDELEDIEALAHTIANVISSEFYAKVSVGISTVAETLKDLAKAYKESRVALEVSKVFDTERNIISYDNLGIGRLVYQLPTTLCDIFLQEVFKKGSLETLDRETLMTVQSFFENNLNVSETSRKLFVHRNTLVYRLEKIRKMTGLDLREFEHAITFKVALMVKKYLASKPTKF